MTEVREHEGLAVAADLVDGRREELLRMNERQFREFVDEQFRAGSVQFRAHQQLLEQNTALIEQNTVLTQQTATNTGEIVELFGASKKGLRFLQAFGAFLNRSALWITRLLVCGAALWSIFHGHSPRGPE